MASLPALCILRCQLKRASAHLHPIHWPAVAISVARGMAYLHTRSPPFLHLDLKSAK